MTSQAIRPTQPDAGPSQPGRHYDSGLVPLPQDIEAFFADQDFTRQFSDADRALLADLVQLRTYTADEIVLLEGQPSDALYFVFRGAVEVLKSDTTLGSQFTITRIERGAMFGEMSFMDREPVSATVRASGPCKVLVIARATLEGADQRDGGHLRHELTGAVAVAVIKRLRHLSGAHVRSLQAELHQARLRNEFLRFFGVTMALFGIASLVQKLINQDLTPTLQMLYSWGFLLLTLAPIAYFARKQGLPLASFGVTWQGSRRAVGESLLVGAGLVLLAVFLRQQVRLPGEPLATWGSLKTYSQTQTAFFFLAYGPHCLLQEFIGRGVIQGSLRRFVTEQRPIAPILLTSALFGIFHFYVSVGFAILTFAISLLFGWLYTRHRTLVGVTLAHYLLGFASIAMGFN